MPVIIYTRRNDGRGAWTDLQTTGFDARGNCLVGEALDHHEAIVVLVVPDDETPPARFRPPTHLFTHNGGPDSQRENAEFTGVSDGFTNIPGNPIYEVLKNLMAPGNSDRKAKVIEDLLNGIDANRNLIALSEFCMIEQIRMLSPNQDEADLEAAKTNIRISEFGRGLLAEDARRSRTGETTGNLIARKLTELNLPA